MNPPINVASWLQVMAQRSPGTVALMEPVGRVRPGRDTPYSMLTFADLHSQTDALAAGLASVGYARGMRCALMVPPSLEFFRLTFAMLKLGLVPVMIDPGMGLKGLKKCLAHAAPEAFFGIVKAHLARRILGWGKGSVQRTLNVGGRRWGCQHSTQELRELGAKSTFTMPTFTASDMAAILFTSGSTGPAKGVTYTHGIFAGQVEMLRQTYGITPGEVDLCTFPLFALFGPALGMTCVIPDMNPTRPASINPAKALHQVREVQATNLFGSPAVLRRLSEVDDSAMSLSSLKRVISAGAPARADVLAKLSVNLPAATEIFTPYGATESLPVANIGSREILGETKAQTDAGQGVCIGRPVAGVEVHIIPISDEVVSEWYPGLELPAGEIGEFVVRSSVTTREYFRRPDATALAKIRDGDTILHRMGDVGYRDEAGRLWFCGRKSHRVVTRHRTYFTDQVEPIFNTIDGVFRTALVGVKVLGETVPVICVEPLPRKHHAGFPGAFRKLAEPLGISEYLFHPGFPVDVRHNSKIFREKLAVWAQKKMEKLA
ncbi:MAG: fatty acid CoA ligase family protein [Fimbriiglobus sp.]